MRVVYLSLKKFSEIICIRLFSLIKRLKVLFTWQRGKSDTEREAK